jgi:hypothetical protein
LHAHAVDFRNFFRNLVNSSGVDSEAPLGSQSLT